jgi:hypothetical protein
MVLFPTRSRDGEPVAIEYVEYIGNAAPGASPSGSLDFEGARITRVIDVPWEQRKQAVVAILGDCWRDGAAIARLGPMQYIDLTYGRLVATRILRVEGRQKPTIVTGKGQVFKNESNYARYRIARFTVQFEALPYNVAEPGQLVRETPKPLGPDSIYILPEAEPHPEYLTLGPGVMKLVKEETDHPPKTQDVQINLRPGKIIGNKDVTITHKAVPEDAVTTSDYNPRLGRPGPADLLIGRINKTDFFGKPPGTMLYLGPRCKRYTTGVGTRVVDVAHAFKYQPYGHHRVPYRRADKTFGWVELSVDGEWNTTGADGKNIYNWGEFHDLFRPP